MEEWKILALMGFIGAVSYALLIADTSAPSAVSGMIIFWDGTQGSIPADWVCISCTTADDFYLRYINVTSSYGTKGGNSIHNHTFSVVTSNSNTTIGVTPGFANGGNIADVHKMTGVSTVSASNSSMPPSRSLLVIRYQLGIPAQIPSGAIVFYNSTTAPTGFTRYTAEDSYFVVGNLTAANITATTGNHTHGIVNVTITTPDTITQGTAGVTNSYSSVSHTHNVTLPAPFNSSNSTPPYVTLPMIKASSNQNLPIGMIVLFNATPNLSFTQLGASAPYSNKLIRADNSVGQNGGFTNHVHNNTRYINLDSNAGASIGELTGVVAVARNTHAHKVNLTINNATNQPPYITALLYRYTPETAGIQVPPNHTRPILVPTVPNTTVNLICKNQTTSDDNDETVFNIFDWRMNVDGGATESYAVVNLPFDTPSDLNTANPIPDYTSYKRNASVGGDLTTRPTWSSSCAVGGCYDFDGGDIMNISNYTKSDKYVTVAAWVYLRSYGAFKIIAANWGGTPRGQFHFSMNGGGNKLTTYITQSDNTQVAGPTDPNELPLNSWQYVAMVANGTNILIYRNGSLIIPSGFGNQPEYDGTLATWFDCVGIGYKPNSNGTASCIGTQGQYWDGLIDDLKIWNKALTPEQIMQNYIDSNKSYNNYSTLVKQELIDGSNMTCCVVPTDLIADGPQNCTSAIVDTCQFISVSNIWTINCSNSCRKTQITYLNQEDIILRGPGNFTLRADIINSGNKTIESCDIYCQGGCFR